MTERFHRFCENHPTEPVQFCAMCLRETRLATREECAELTRKMDQYREAILGPQKKNGRDEDENIP